MKKILLLAVGLCLIAGTGLVYASSTIKPFDPVYNESWMQMKAADFVKLSIKDFATLSQKKLTVKEKIAFTVLKKQLKREIKKNPDVIVGAYLAENKKISTGAWIAIIAGVVLIVCIIVASTIKINWAPFG